jgi:hypothetical protein
LEDTKGEENGFGRQGDQMRLLKIDQIVAQLIFLPK